MSELGSSVPYGVGQGRYEVQANNGRRQRSHGLNDALATGEEWREYENLSCRVVDLWSGDVIERWGTQRDEGWENPGGSADTD